MSRQKLQEFLAGLPDLAARSQAGMSAADFTLDRMRGLMAALGQPQQRYPSVHVAGTNGKGSVCALCAAALQAQGYRVGTFTSPHVAGALHGIRIDGEVVPLAELEATFAELQPYLVPDAGYTHFEVLTALMFLHFARAGVNAAVIEVGLGGGLDATNVLTPTVSVITSIDYDHMPILGNTLAEIAAHKAGIIKPGVPAVSAPQAAQARDVIVAQAAAAGASLIEVGRDCLYERGAYDLDGQELRIWQPGGQPQTLRIGLLGSYQVENAAVAFAALQAAAGRGLRANPEAIRVGFQAARWPGRFELIHKDPPLVLDAAHTPGAAMALRRSLDEYFSQQPIVLVLGVSIDKDVEGLLAPLLPRLGRVIATQSLHARAMPAAQLAARLAALGLQAETNAEPGAALRAARTQAAPGQVVLVAGSVFLVEAVRENLEGR
jgi:dihydrofolate synthase/folylpolyglutamate synthase